MKLCCGKFPSRAEAAEWTRTHPRRVGLIILAVMLAAMWIVWLTGVLTGCNGDEDEAPCLATAPPRSLRGFFLGVPFSWLCHHDLGHIAGNSVGLALYAAMIVLRSGGPWHFLGAAFSSQLVFAIGTWLGRGACGASGMVFGLFAYTICLGLLKVFGLPPRPKCGRKCFCGCVGEWCAYQNWLCTLGSVGDLALTIVVFVLFGSLVFGAFPQGGGVSWEGHLWGCLGGSLFAAAVAVRERKRMVEERAAGRSGASISGLSRSSMAQPCLTTHTTIAGSDVAVSCTPQQLASAAAFGGSLFSSCQAAALGNDDGGARNGTPSNPFSSTTNDVEAASQGTLQRGGSVWPPPANNPFFAAG